MKSVILLTLAGLFLAGCTKDGDKTEGYTITPVLAEGFLHMPDCRLTDADESMEPIRAHTETGKFTLKTTETDSLYLITCHPSSLERYLQPLHGFFFLTQDTKDISVPVDPFSEVVYRLSQKSPENLKANEKRLATTLVWPNPPPSPANIPYKNALLSLMRYSAAHVSHTPEKEAIHLKGLISTLELIALNKLPLNQWMDPDTLRAFLLTGAVPDQQEWLLAHYHRLKPRTGFNFHTKEVIVPFSNLSYSGGTLPALDDTPVEWTSSDPQVATVDNSGKVSFISAGEVTITASLAASDQYEPAVATYRLVIQEALLPQADFYFDTDRPAITLSNTTFSLIPAGGSGTGTIGYRSSDSRIAFINREGVVTPKQVGSVVITATKSGDAMYNQTHAQYTLDITGLSVTKASGEVIAASLNPGAALQAAAPGDVFEFAGPFTQPSPLSLRGIQGTASQPVILRGHPRLGARLSGKTSLEAISSGDWQAVTDPSLPQCRNRCFKRTLTTPVVGLWINDEEQKMARWPDYNGHPAPEIPPSSTEPSVQPGSFWDNARWARVESIDQPTLPATTWLINDDSVHDLTIEPDFSGSKLYIRNLGGTNRVFDIESHVQGSNRLEIDYLLPLTLTGSAFFYIEGKAALSQNGEYFFDMTDNSLWMYLESGTPPDNNSVSVRTTDHLLDLSDASHIRIEGLTIDSGTLKCNTSCANITLANTLFTEAIPYRQFIHRIFRFGENGPSDTFDPGLFSPNYYPLNSHWPAPGGSITLHREQGYRYPQTDFPGLTPLQSIFPEAGTGEVTLQWLAPTSMNAMQVFAGSDVSNLTQVCNASRVIPTGINQCRVSSSRLSQQGFFWQVRGTVSGNAVRSFIFTSSFP